MIRHGGRRHKVDRDTWPILLKDAPSSLIAGLHDEWKKHVHGKGEDGALTWHEWLLSIWSEYLNACQSG